MICDLH